MAERERWEEIRNEVTGRTIYGKPGQSAERLWFEAACKRIAALEQQIAEVVTLRPFDEWHEDYGDALWWRQPVCESPYAGQPGDRDWPLRFTDDSDLVWLPCPSPSTDRIWRSAEHRAAGGAE